MFYNIIFLHISSVLQPAVGEAALARMTLFHKWYCAPPSLISTCKYSQHDCFSYIQRIRPWCLKTVHLLNSSHHPFRQQSSLLALEITWRILANICFDCNDTFLTGTAIDVTFPPWATAPKAKKQGHNGRWLKRRQTYVQSDKYPT